MLAQSHARKPAPPLAARGMWLRLGIGADAFGSALGDAVVQSIKDNDSVKAPKKTFAQDVADRKAALNPYGWSTAPSAAAAPSDDRVATFMAYGMSRSEAIERINNGEIMSDAGPQGGVRPVGQNGEPTAQVILPPNPALTGGAVGGGYKPANLDSIRGTPGYDPKTDMPTLPGFDSRVPDFKLPPSVADFPSKLWGKLEGSPIVQAGINLIFSEPADGKPTYQIGASDGGPGEWREHRIRLNDADRDYQIQVTGAPSGVEYRVPTKLMASGEKWFDGYDPATKRLVDAKRYENWPKEELPFSMSQTRVELTHSNDIAKENKTVVQFSVANKEKAAILQQIVKEERLKNTVIVHTPKK